MRKITFCCIVIIITLFNNTAYTQTIVGTDLDPNYPIINPGDSFTANFQISNTTGQNITGYLLFRSRSPGGHYEFAPDANGNYSQLITITPGTNWYSKVCVLYSSASPGVYRATFFISPTTSWGDYWDSQIVNNAFEVLTPPDPELIGYDLDPNYPMVLPGESFNSDFQIYNAGSQSISGYLHFRSRSPAGHYEFLPDGNGNYSKFVTITSGTNWYSKECVLYSGADPGVYDVTLFISPTTSWGDYWDVLQVNDAIEVLDEGPDDFFVEAATVSQTTLQPGQTFNASCEQHYSGNSSTTLNPELGYYLSTNTTYGSSDVLLDVDGSTLDKDDLYDSENQDLTIPSGTSEGPYYILFFADHIDEYPESNENNNISYVQITVDIPDPPSIVGTDLDPDYPQVFPDESFTANYQISNTTGQNITGYLHFRSRSPAGHYEFLPDANGNYSKLITITPGTNWYSQECVLYSSATPGVYNVTYFISPTTSWGDYWDAVTVNNTLEVLEVPDPVIVGYDLDPDYPSISPGESFTANYQILNGGNQNITGYLHFRSRSPGGHYEFLPDANGNYSKLITIIPGTNWYSQECILYSSADPGVYDVTYFISPTTSWGDYWDAETLNNAFEVKGINILQPESNITVNQGDIVDIEWEGAAESGWAVSLKYDEDEIWDNSNETWIAWGLPISGTYEWDTENIEPGVYHIGGMISDNVDYEYDYASSTVEILPGYGATLELYRVTDTQGTQNTDDPGNIISDFIPGSTVRVTMRAINTGASIPVQCVLNIIGPDNVTVAYDSNIEGANNSTDSPLESGEGYDYYSFDWLVPNYAETGTYDIGAALRDEFDFDLLYETTCDGPNTDFNCDWIIEDQFSVIPTSNYSSTSIGALTELANLRGVFSGYGNLHDLYEDNKKQLAYFSASFVLGVAIYIDLADYYSAMYPNDYITEEGRDGWITVWIDGSVGFDFSVLPAGFGLSAPLDFVPPDCDPKRNMWSIDAINSSMPFLQTDGIQWQWDNNNGWSFDWGNISTSPTTEISANIVKLGRNVARFEVQKETLDLIVDNGITNGVSGPGAITNNAVIIARIHNICSEIVDFKDYWKVIPQLFQTRQFSQFDNGENPQIAGVLNHLRGGYDINYDNIPDNYYPISATNIFGVPLIVLEDYVTFHNIGEELTDFYVKVTDVPSGWWITAWDGGIIPPAIDHKFRIDNVPIHNWTDGDEAETTWGISATENAPDMAIVTFELRKNNHNPLVEGELLDTKTDTLFKIDALNNVPPQITFLEPNVDVTKFNGEPIQLIWDDEDVNNNAFINIAIDPDLSNQPWIGSPNHVWIAQGIDEDPDGIYDTFEWDISGLSVGSYSLWIAIADGIADPVFSRAPGIVNILDNGYLTEIIINSSAEMWYNSNPNIDIDFKNIFGLNNIWYQIDSNDDNNPSNWHSLTSDGASVLSESQNCPGTIMNTDWMISNVDWTALPMNAQTLGTYHLYFKVTDDLGNTFITPDENDAFEFRKDIFPPTVSVYYPTPNLVHNSSTLTANWYSGDLITGLELSGVNKVYFKLNTESSYNEVDASTNSHIYSGLSDGLYTFYIYAIDNANNQSNEIVVDFEINTAINPPTPFALTDPNIGDLTTITPLLHWQISTDPDGTPVEYELYYADNVEYNNQTVESNLTTNSYQFDGFNELDYDQQYYWKVKAIDGNGQERWCNQLDWWFQTETDPLPPFITISSISHDYGNAFIGDCSDTYTFTLTNTGGGIATGNVELQDAVKEQINNGLTNSNKFINENDIEEVKISIDEGGQKSALDFEITEGEGSFSLAAGISKEIKIRFCPQNSGYLEAMLAAVGTGSTNSVSSSLSGTGIQNNYLNLSQDIVEATYSSFFYHVDVYSNVSWSVLNPCDATPPDDWLTVSPMNGTNNETLTLSWDYNSTNQPRSCTVTIEGGGITETLIVDQEVNPYAIMDLFSTNVSCEAGSYEVNVSSNTDWTLDFGCGWVTIDPIGGEFDGSFTVTYDENTTGVERCCEISGTYGPDGDSWSHHICQAPCSASEITISLPDINVIPAEEVLIDITVDDITAGKLISGFQISVRSDDAYLSWNGTNTGPASGVAYIHPNLTPLGPDWLWNEELTNEMIFSWVEPTFYNPVEILPGEVLITLSYTYLGGIPEGESSPIYFGFDVAGKNKINPKQKYITEIYDENFDFFDITAVDGSITDNTSSEITISLPEVYGTPGEEVLIDITVDDISPGSLISGFQISVRSEDTYLSWNGSNSDPSPGVTYIHPNLTPLGPDWLWNNELINELIFSWVEPTYMNPAEIAPGEVLLTLSYAYNGGIPAGEFSPLSFGFDKAGENKINPKQKFVTEIYDENFDYFNITPVDGSIYGAPHLTVTPSSYDFGEVEWDFCSDPNTFMLENDGGSAAQGYIPLYISSFIVSNISTGDYEFNLPPGESLYFDVEFCPLHPTSYNGDLIIDGYGVCNDPEVHLSGEGFMYISVITVANPPEGGTTTGDGTYMSYDYASIHAIANPGYKFDYWYGGGLSSDSIFSPHHGFSVAPYYDYYWVAHFKPIIELDLQVFLEGPFNGTTMNTSISSSPEFPLNQPFGISPWNYDGDESITALPNPDIVDWVLVELRETTGNASTATDTAIVARQAAFILADGSIVDLDGVSHVKFDTTLADHIYAVVWHRNHLGIMSSAELTQTDGIYSYAFYSSIDQAYGGAMAQKDLGGNIYGMIGGDGNADGHIDNKDKNDIWINQRGSAGYLAGDFNMDNDVDDDDKIMVWTPNAGRSFVIPESFQVAPWQCGDALIDDRDSQIYATVHIGDQCWMAENLNYDNSTGTFCYDDIPENCDTFGSLYNWDIANIVCPEGWHLPSQGEWQLLFNNVGGNAIAGGKLKSTGTKEAGTGLWSEPNLGATDEFGFSALPGGNSIPGISSIIYYGINTQAHFWTTSEEEDLTDYHNTTYMSSNNSKSYHNRILDAGGANVRCLKDGNTVNLPPIPPNIGEPNYGSTNQPLNTVISWTCDDPENDPLTFDVFLDIVDPPLNQVSTGQTDTAFNSIGLIPDTTYYWKIVVHDGFNTTEGYIWYFSTGSYSWQCGDPIIDDRDDQSYNTVQIGNQCWMAENLNFGTQLDRIENQQNNSLVEKYCFDDSEDSCSVYGGIYQWDELMDYQTVEGSQGICPVGWHVPTDYEWCILENLADSDTILCGSENWRGLDAGANLKETGLRYWNSPNTGATNSTYFYARGAGYYNYNGLDILGLGQFSQYWTSTTNSSTNYPWMRGLRNDLITIRRVNQPQEYGLSLRCIKD